MVGNNIFFIIYCSDRSRLVIKSLSSNVLRNAISFVFSSSLMAMPCPGCSEGSRLGVFLYPAAVMIDHRIQRIKSAVVHVRCGVRQVTEARHFEFVFVGRVERHEIPSFVIVGSYSNAVVAEREICKQRSACSCCISAEKR
jgi:hypothetical protein